ncbi:MAG: hypothetical protein EBU92_09790 [Betaproteobacteria bacterium]|nr:hypothetical protein [Betaproteobacteria bacterium]
MGTTFLRVSVLVVWGLIGMSAVTAADKAADPVVKKSDSGICHDKSSPSFANTKKFTAFNSVDECVKSGGKLPGAK